MLVEMQPGDYVRLGDDGILVLLSVEKIEFNSPSNVLTLMKLTVLLRRLSPPFHNDGLTFRGHASSSHDEVGGTPSGHG